LIRDVERAGGGSFIGVYRFDAAVVDGELFEVGKNGKRQLRRPSVTSELKSRADVVLQVDRGLLRFQEELPGSPDAEAVVGRLSERTDLNSILMDDVLVGFSVALLVVDVPAQGFKEGVNELLSKLGFVVCTRAVGFAIALKPLNEFKDFFGSRDLALLSLCLLIIISQLEITSIQEWITLKKIEFASSCPMTSKKTRFFGVASE
jgi:hypothetical protein